MYSQLAPRLGQSLSEKAAQARAVRDFVQAMQENDRVLVTDGQTIRGIGLVAGEAYQ